MDDRSERSAIDGDAVAIFWQDFLSDSDRRSDTSVPDAWQFGDSTEMADSLLALVVGGPKRATAGSLADYEADDEPLPAVGDLAVLCDGAGLPRAIIETIEIRVGPLSSVDDQFAWDEGEGDRSRTYWLRAHTDYFTRRHHEIGAEMHADIAVVFERFDLLYPVSTGDRSSAENSSKSG